MKYKSNFFRRQNLWCVYLLTPLRWQATEESLRYAIALSKHEEIARHLLICRILGHLDFGVHELPYGYCGNILEDIGKLREVQTLISEINDGQMREEYMKELQRVKELVLSYADYVASNAPLTFKSWAELNNRPFHPW